jgi:hypothetical protein
MAKRNRTKDKYAGAYLKQGGTPKGVQYMDVFYSNVTLIAFLMGVHENSLGWDSRQLHPTQ